MGPCVAIRVGISTGQVAAVLLGKCRRFYCIYGDTVNTAGFGFSRTIVTDRD